MTEKELLELKEEISEIKSSIAKLEGRKQALMEQLNKDFTCKSIKEAKALIQKKKKTHETKMKRKEELSKEIETKYFE